MGIKGNRGNPDKDKKVPGFNLPDPGKQSAPKQTTNYPFDKDSMSGGADGANFPHSAKVTDETRTAEFVVIAEFSDYLTCTNGTEKIFVAKPQMLRQATYDGKSFGGVSYAYSNKNTRVASDDASVESDETQYITPTYIVGEVILAVNMQEPITIAGPKTFWQEIESNRSWATSGQAYLTVGNNLSDLGSTSTSRTNLGVAIGSDVQAYDAGLADLSGLAVTDGNFIVGDGSNWVAESGSTALASLGISSGDISNWDTAYGWGNHAGLYDPSGTMTTHESTFNHGNYNSAYTHIGESGASHTYIDQSVISGASPTFTGTNISGVPAASILAGTFGTGAYVFDNTVSGITTLTATTITDGTWSTTAGVFTGVASIDMTGDLNMNANDIIACDDIQVTSISERIDSTGVLFNHEIFANGNITILNPVPILVLKDSSSAGDSARGTIEWRDLNNIRLGYFGNSSGSNDELLWKNLSSGGHIQVQTTGAGEFQIYANAELNANSITSVNDIQVTSISERIGDAGITINHTLHMLGNYIDGTSGVLFGSDTSIKIDEGARINANNGTDDNLVINGKGTGATYINFDAGSGGVNFCDGASSIVATIGVTGIGTFTGIVGTSLDLNGPVDQDVTISSHSGDLIINDWDLTVASQAMGANWIYGNFYELHLTGNTASSQRVQAFYARPYNRTSGAIGQMASFVGDPYFFTGNSGNVTDVRNIWGANGNYSGTASGTITNWSQFYASNCPTATGKITNAYGLYLEEMTGGGTLNYQIYSVGGLSYHGGDFEFGGIITATGGILADDISELTADHKIVFGDTIDFTLCARNGVTSFQNTSYVRHGTGDPSSFDENPAPGALYVTNELEVDGVAWFDSKVRIADDLYFTGEGSGLLFGSIWYMGAGTNTVLAAQDTWYQVLGFDTDGLNNGTTPDHTNDHIVVPTAGKYRVSINISARSAASNSFQWMVRINNGNSDCTNIMVHQATPVAGKIDTGACNDFCDLAANDTVELWVLRTDGGAVAKTITHEHLVLNVEQIGGT